MIRVSGTILAAAPRRSALPWSPGFTMPSQIARHLAAGGVAKGSLERPLKYKYKGVSTWMQTVSEKSLITLDSLPEAYIRLDSKFRCTFVNQAAQLLLDQIRVRARRGRNRKEQRPMQQEQSGQPSTDPAGQ
jgi:PAS domain-containing protein